MKDIDFIKKASDLFLQYGAKSLTMDDVAREFGMSKKTLYQKYKNKESLLEDVLECKLDEITERIEEIEAEVENAVERMYCREEQMENTVESNESIFIKQLIKYYPKIFEKHMMKFSEKFASIMFHNIERGREQGYYRTDFDEKRYAKFFFHLILSYHNSTIFEAENIEKSEYSRLVLDFYMNAITTEKGKKFIQKNNLI